MSVWLIPSLPSFPSFPFPPQPFYGIAYVNKKEAVAAIKAYLEQNSNDVILWVVASFSSQMGVLNFVEERYHDCFATLQEFPKQDNDRKLAITLAMGFRDFKDLCSGRVEEMASQMFGATTYSASIADHLNVYNMRYPTVEKNVTTFWEFVVSQYKTLKEVKFADVVDIEKNGYSVPADSAGEDIADKSAGGKDDSAGPKEGEASDSVGAGKLAAMSL